MIKISIVSYNNQPLSVASSAIFDDQGRTLGRSRDNYLVLDDPKNLVSRTQASVKSEGMHHTITNLSHSTPILLNGREIEANRTCALGPGDEIRIGLHVLRAEAAAGSSAVQVARPDLPDPAAANAPPMPNTVIGTGGALLSPSPSDSAAAPAKAENVDVQALTQAFIKGAGIPPAALSQGLTPELMEMIGQLLAASVKGTMDLNALRALVKREVNAEVTQVVVRNNNPLKFLQDEETVLIQMFRKKMPGFMGPTEAMEDAYEDLRLHQLGVVAGMRAALADMLRRLSPEKLDGQVKSRPLSDALLPANRKARLWDLYGGLFAKMHAETQDDSRMLFGPAFLEAYEQEIERLKNHAKPS